SCLLPRTGCPQKTVPPRPGTAETDGAESPWRYIRPHPCPFTARFGRAERLGRLTRRSRRRTAACGPPVVSFHPPSSSGTHTGCVPPHAQRGSSHGCWRRTHNWDDLRRAPGPGALEVVRGGNIRGSQLSAAAFAGEPRGDRRRFRGALDCSCRSWREAFYGLAPGRIQFLGSRMAILVPVRELELAGLRHRDSN